MAHTWTELPDFPLKNKWENVVARPIMHDKKKIMAVSDGGDVCEFDIDSRKWMKIHGTDGVDGNFSVAFDNENNKLYVIGGVNALYTLCIQTGKVEKNQLSVKIGERPALSFVNDKLHIIGGHGNGKHFVWDDNKNELKLLHSIQESIRQRIEKCIIDPCAITKYIGVIRWI